MPIMTNRLLLLVPAAGLALAACTTTPPAQDPVLLRLTDMEARLIRIERVVDNQRDATLLRDNLSRGESSEYAELLFGTDTQIIERQRHPVQCS